MWKLNSLGFQLLPDYSSQAEESKSKKGQRAGFGTTLVALILVRPPSRVKFEFDHVLSMLLFLAMGNIGMRPKTARMRRGTAVMSNIQLPGPRSLHQPFAVRVRLCIHPHSAVQALDVMIELASNGTMHDTRVWWPFSRTPYWSLTATKVFGGTLQTPERFERMKWYVLDRLADGTFHPRIDRVFRFEEVADAYS